MKTIIYELNQVTVLGLFTHVTNFHGTMTFKRKSRGNQTYIKNLYLLVKRTLTSTLYIFECFTCVFDKNLSL